MASDYETNLLDALRKSGKVPEETIQQFMRERKQNPEIDLVTWMQHHLAKKYGAETAKKTIDKIVSEPRTILHLPKYDKKNAHLDKREQLWFRAALERKKAKVYDVRDYLNARVENSQLDLFNFMKQRGVDEQSFADIESIVMKQLNPDSHAKTVEVGRPEKLQKPKASPPALQRYEFISLLGEGGFGAVYLAKDKQLERLVAIKLLTAKVRGVSEEEKAQYEEAVARFDNEARNMAGIRHPNVVNIHDVGELTGSRFIVMDYIEGRKNLEGLVDDLHAGKPFSLTPGKAYKIKEPECIKDLLQLFSSACEGMAYMHSERVEQLDKEGKRTHVKRKIIHRDLKPANIFLDTHKKIYIGDLGLSKRLKFSKSNEMQEPDPFWDGSFVPDLSDAGERRSVGQLTQEGIIIGTLAYMPPEQFQGMDNVDEKSDIYCMGLTLYKLLTLHDFRQAGTSLQHFNAARKGTYTPARFHNPAITPEVESILAKMVAAEPEQRYNTFGAVITDIQHFIRGEKVNAHKYGTLENTTRWLSKNVIKLTAAAGILFTAAVGATGYAFYEGASRRAAEQKTIAAEEKTAKEKQERIAAQERAAKIEAELEAKTLKTERNIRQEASIELSKAVDFSKRGDLENAIKACENAIKIDGKYPDAYYERGLMNYAQLKSAEAITDFEKAIKFCKDETGKTHVPSAFYAGMVHIDLLEDPITSAKYFNDLLKETTDEKEPYVMFSKSLSKFAEGIEKFKSKKLQDAQKSCEESIKIIDAAIARFPKMWEPHFLKAMYQSAGVGGAFNYSMLAPFQNYTGAIDSLTKALEESKNNSRCLVQRVWLYCTLRDKLGNLDGAFADAELLIKIHPKVPVFKTTLGFVYYMGGKYDKSLEELIAAESSGDDSVPNAVFQALNYMELQQYQKAEQYFTKAIDKKHAPPYYASRSEVRLKLGNKKGAMEDANASLELDPNNGQAYYSRGLCNALDNKTENAVSDFKQATVFGYHLAHLDLGILYYREYQKTKDKAISAEALAELKKYLQYNDPYRANEAMEIIKVLRGD